MKELYHASRQILEKCYSRGREWHNVKTELASVIAKYLAENYKSIREIYLIDLSGGEANNTLEGGSDIDLYIETSDPREVIELKRVEELIDKVVRDAVKDTLKTKCGNTNRNLVEFHINSEFVKPLLKSKYSYKEKLYSKI